MARKRLARILLFLFVIFFFFIFFFLQEGITSAFFAATIPESVLEKTASLVHDEGQIEAHFCPRENCELLLLEFLEQAEVSIHCAFYDLGLSSVQEELMKKKNEGKDVRMVTDDAYLKRFPQEFVRADERYGLMHNKFCIVDGKKVSTGSMNPTKSDARQNLNNLLLISSPRLAQDYEDEFAELWQGLFKGGEATKNPGIDLGETKIEVFFCPEDFCAEKVKEKLREAQASVHFMTFSFTDEDIAQELLFKKMEGITIRGLMDKTQAAGEYSVYPLLKYQEVEVVKYIMRNGETYKSRKVNSELAKNSLLHHKVFIIDAHTVLTGSFNPTRSGNERNDENLLIIYNTEIAEQYIAEFQRLWNETEKNREVN